MVEAARLVLGGHQEHVAAGLDQVRKPVVEVQPDRDLVGVARFDLLQQILVPVLPGSQHDQLEVQLGQRIDALLDQVESFLVRQPGDDPHQRHASRGRRQAESPPQLGFAHRFA